MSMEADLNKIGLFGLIGIGIAVIIGFFIALYILFNFSM